MTAYKELLEATEGETVEAVVFGEWGWGQYRSGVYPVPKDKQGVLLTLAEAEQYMHGWRISGGFGAPNCHAMYVWTDKAVYWIHEYDGSTCLSRAPRNPEAVEPKFCGQ